MRVEDATAGMILAQDVLDDQGHLLLEKGIHLTTIYLTRLKSLGVQSIHVTDPYAESLKSKKIIPPELREELTQCFTDLFQMKAADILNFNAPAHQLENLNRVVETVIDETSRQLGQVVNTQVRQPSVDETQHAVNVCLLSVITGLYLKFDRKILHELALGSLLHDLGRSMLVLGEKDTDFLHTIYSRELLLRSNLNPVVATIAAEHHEAYDGSGHPRALTGREIHPLSRLVFITNYFDMLLSEKDSVGLSRQEAIEKMVHEDHHLFDVNLLRAFMNTVAIFPVGSLVRLNTGDPAYIVSNRIHFPLRPLVRVVHDSGHKEIDLVLKPNISIAAYINE